MQNYNIEYYLPEKILDNYELERVFSSWSADEIFAKTGIESRHISDENQYASDLAVCAANNLFNEYKIDPKSITFLIIVTQSPDYILPNTACLVQNSIGMSKNAGAIDINLGCSGYIYALSIAKALVSSLTVENVLIITTDTYSKYIHNMDKSIRTLFGDGASATYISNECPDLNNYITYGTDGSGYDKFIIPASGLRFPKNDETKKEIVDRLGFIRTMENIYMNGPEIFMFTAKLVPKIVFEALKKANMTIEEIDLFVFHQASGSILSYIKDKLGLEDKKVFNNIRYIGNTVSSSIPIALKDAEKQGILIKGNTVMLIGFGVGLSWGTAIIKW